MYTLYPVCVSVCGCVCICVWVCVGVGVCACAYVCGVLYVCVYVVCGGKMAGTHSAVGCVAIWTTYQGSCGYQ